MPTPIGSGGICNVTPSDLIAVRDNLLDQIKALQDDVAKLKLLEVQTQFLSNIANQAGWISNVTFMGVDGWTQTPSGTLIPPAGVTFSSLGISPPAVGGSSDALLQLLAVNAAGSLQFGIDAEGNLSGAMVDAWNGIGVSAYADVGWHNNTFSSILSGVSIDSTSRGAGVGTVIITGMTPGFYFATGNVTQYVEDGDGSAGAIINGFLTLGVIARTAVADTSGVVTTLGSAREAATTSAFFHITSTAQVIDLGWEANVLDGSATFGNPYELALQVIRVSG